MRQEMENELNLIHRTLTTAQNLNFLSFNFNSIHFKHHRRTANVKRVSIAMNTYTTAGLLSRPLGGSTGVSTHSNFGHFAAADPQQLV